LIIGKLLLSTFSTVISLCLCNLVADLLFLCNSQLCASCSPIIRDFLPGRYNWLFRDNPVNAILFILLKIVLDQSIFQAVKANNSYSTISL